MMLGLYFFCGLLLSGLIFFFPKKKIASLLTFIFIMLQVIITIYAFSNRDRVEMKYFTYDSLSLIFLMIMNLISAATFYHSLDYVKEDSNKKRSLFFFSFILLNLSLTGVYTANNIIVSWIFIELTTLAAAGLINHNRQITSLEATWKYVFICSVGIALAYIGILFASVSAGGSLGGDMSYSGLKASFAMIDPVYLKVAFVLILAGYSSKMEVFPLYTIGIDANYVAPAPVSAFLSTALVNGGFVAFFRVFSAMSDSSASEWINHVMILTGIISLLVAAIYVQKASNLKRIFAYSTVEHMGIVLIALSLGKIGIYIALLQLTIHSFIKSGLFFQAGILHRILKSYKLSKISGYLAINSFGAIILLLGVVLISAIPPSGLFVSEFLLFREMASVNWWLFWIVAALLTMVFYGIINRNLRVTMGYAPHSHVINGVVKRSEFITQIVFFSLAVIACFYLPDFLGSLFASVSGTDFHSPFSLLNLQ